MLPYVVAGLAVLAVALIVAAYFVGLRQGRAEAAAPAYDPAVVAAEKKTLSDMWARNATAQRDIAHQRADLNAAIAAHAQSLEAAQTAVKGADDASVDDILRADGAGKPAGQ